MGDLQADDPTGANRTHQNGKPNRNGDPLSPIRPITGEYLWEITGSASIDYAPVGSTIHSACVEFAFGAG
jgi:hypothetical protein